MTEDQESGSVEEINRLVALGLDVMTAVDVAEGRRDESFEVARVGERVEINKWCTNMSSIPTAVEPLWDLLPEHFHLVFDGSAPNDEHADELELVNVDVAEVDRLLTFNASRDRHPWHREYKRKSCGIVYRWSHGRGVTPPLIRTVQNQIHIDGGMHRFHLAKHNSCKCIPCLIWSWDRDAIFSVLPSKSVSLGHVDKWRNQMRIDVISTKPR